MALVTVAQVKVYLPHVLAASTSEDSTLTTMIARAEAVIAENCGYPPVTVGTAPTLDSSAYTRYLDGPGGKELVIDVWPVTAITSIYDDPAWTWAAASLVASADYTLLDGDHGLIVLKETAAHGGWNRARKSVKATVTAGFTSAPANLAHAICLLVATYHKRRSSTGVERQSTADGASVEMERGLPKEVAELLGPFLLPGSLL